MPDYQKLIEEARKLAAVLDRERHCISSYIRVGCLLDLAAALEELLAERDRFRAECKSDESITFNNCMDVIEALQAKVKTLKAERERSIVEVGALRGVADFYKSQYVRLKAHCKLLAEATLDAQWKGDYRFNDQHGGGVEATCPNCDAWMSDNGHAPDCIVSLAKKYRSEDGDEG